MKILYLGINYYPEETGIGAFNTYRCEYLASRGHDVTVCTGFPYYPEWRVDARYRGKLWANDCYHGVRVARGWLYVPQQVSSLKRIAHEASFVATSLIRALGQRRPDLIVAASPPLALGASAITLSRIWGVPYVYDVEDLQPDAAVELGMLRNPLLLRALYRLEYSAYRNAALVSTLTEGMRQRIIGKGIPEEKVALFSPRADPALFVIERSAGEPFRQRHGLTGKYVITHSGNMGIKQGLEIILRAAAAITDRDVIFLMVGDGADRPRLLELAGKFKLSNVRFLPLLERAEFDQLLAATDLALVTQQRSVSDIVFPSKTVTYLAAGCPVIASVNNASEIARVIHRSGAGMVVPPEDAEALLQAITAIRATDRREFAQRGRAYAIQSWSHETVLGQFERRLMQCIPGPASFGPTLAQEGD